ncbi:hypothetical protein V2J09_021507 [Rumex salicifolius]
MPSVTIEQEALVFLAKEWKNSVVFKLLRRTLGFQILERKLREMWKPSGSFIIVDLPDGYSIVRFDQEQDFFSALTGGPWTVFCQCLMVKNWVFDFKPVRDSIKKSVHGVIGCIASSIGNPIRIDKYALHATRGKFTRLNMKKSERSVSDVGSRVTLLTGSLSSTKNQWAPQTPSTGKGKEIVLPVVVSVDRNSLQPMKMATNEVLGAKVENAGNDPTIEDSATKMYEVASKLRLSLQHSLKASSGSIFQSKQEAKRGKQKKDHPELKQQQVNIKEGMTEAQPTQTYESTSDPQRLKGKQPKINSRKHNTSISIEPQTLRPNSEVVSSFGSPNGLRVLTTRPYVVDTPMI